MSEPYLNLLSEPTFLFRSSDNLLDRLPDGPPADGPPRLSAVLALSTIRTASIARNWRIEHVADALEL